MSNQALPPVTDSDSDSNQMENNIKTNETQVMSMSPTSSVGDYDNSQIMNMSATSVQSVQNNEAYLPYSIPSNMTMYTIPSGTIIYHGSQNKETFNPYDIKLGEDNLISFFSPNKRFTADYIMGCAAYPVKSGYIHKFRLKKDLSRIMIVSAYEKKKNWNIKHLQQTYCNYNQTIGSTNGIGFFFPKENKATNPADALSNEILYESEFAICNPNEYLEYLSTQRCMSMRNLSNEYHFYK
jgi:hypothetical protein